MNDARIETEARDAAQEALSVAESSGNTPALVFALIASSVLAHQTGHLAEARQHAEAAVALSQHDPASRRLHAERWLARAQLATDDHAGAAITLNEGQRAATSLGTAWTQPMWHYDRAEWCLSRGKVTDALVEAETGLRVADVLSAHALAVPLLTMQAWCQGLMGDLDAAEDSLTRADAWLESGVVANPGFLNWTRVNMALARGELDRLPGLIARATPRLPDRRSPVVANGSFGIQAIRALLAADSASSPATSPGCTRTSRQTTRAWPHDRAGPCMLLVCWRATRPGSRPRGRRTRRPGARACWAGWRSTSVPSTRSKIGPRSPPMRTTSRRDSSSSRAPPVLIAARPRGSR
jgi:hypothetical protein